MRKIFTKSFMEENCGCYSPGKLQSCSFMSLKQITIESILNSDIRLKDKFWFCCKKLFTKEQNQQVAISISEIVLPIYEKRYPEDKRVRECIEAAKQYIAGHISLEQLKEKRYAAAAAAAAASYAAAYAYAAAAAAYAAAAAAYAADDAAAAAYAAAYAAAADMQKQLLNYLITFVNNN